MVERAFERMIGDMTAFDVGCLLSMDVLRNNVFVYSHALNSVHRPSKSELPWPVVFVCARYSKKHIFSQFLPSKSQMGAAINDLTQKIKWASVLRNGEPPWWFRHRGSKHVKTCDHWLVPPEVKAMTSILESKLHDASFLALKKEFGGAKSRCNMPNCVKYALAWLQGSSKCAVPTDKDGGFCIMENSAVMDMLESNLTLPVYDEILPMTINHGTIIRDFCKLLDKSRRLFDDDVFVNRAIMYAKEQGGDSLVSKIIFTIKTHKEAGNIKLRVIHVGVNDPFKFFFQWVRRYLQRHLATCTCILNSTDQLIGCLGDVQTNKRTQFSTFDIDNFYLNGTHHDLAVSCSCMLVGESKRLLYDLLMFTLYHQYVSAEQLEFRTWAVRLGSGMGKTCSGEISDWHFYLLVEQPYATV
eukprot:12043907-Karenia_brevis.AAC.1